MEVSTIDLQNASKALSDADLAGDACEWTEKVIDYLDHIRQHYVGSHFPTEAWFKKQALDWTISLIHQLRKQVLHCPDA